MPPIGTTIRFLHLSRAPLLFRMSILKSGYVSYDGQKHSVFQGFSLCGYKYSRSE